MHFFPRSRRERGKSVKTWPSVECQTKMKEIQLKEICLDIEVQLPREECHMEEKEECKYEPREIVVQR